MLERVALNQTRFRTPGLTPDARGVVLGQRGLLLFSSLDRAVAFLRAYSHAATLDELVHSLQITQLVTSLKTREVAISFVAESTQRMDRIAGIARLASGLIFTGTSKHFVKYRDAGSPLGYDVSASSQDASDMVLYHDAFEQSYKADRTIPLRDLILRLSVEAAPRAAHGEASSLIVTAEMGIAPAVVRHLARAGVDGLVSYVEWAQDSAFDDAPRRLQLFALADAHPRFISLLSSLPGVRVFVPVTANVAVELGHRHPVALDSCASLFDAQSLVLFRTGGVDIVSPRPSAVPLRSLVKLEASALPRVPDSVMSSRTDLETFTVPLRLRPSGEPWRNVTATVVPMAMREWLLKILYLLPADILHALRVASTDSKIFVLSPRGIEGVPLGTFFTEFATRIHVPAGWAIEPALSPEVLVPLLSLPANSHAFFDLETSALDVVDDSAFGPITRLALSAIHIDTENAEPWQSGDSQSPELSYGDRTSLPLWGVPGKTDDADAKDNEP